MTSRTSPPPFARTGDVFRQPAESSSTTRYGYEVRFSHFLIVGLCSECLGARPDAAVSDDEARPDSLDAHEHSHGDYVHSHSLRPPGKGHQHVH